MTASFWPILHNYLVDAAPSLPGAACVGRHALFDAGAVDEEPEQVEYRHQRAAEICRHCPVFADCRAWSETLSQRRRPAGVLAGRIPNVKRQRGRPKRSAA